MKRARPASLQAGRTAPALVGAAPRDRRAPVGLGGTRFHRSIGFRLGPGFGGEQMTAKLLERAESWVVDVPVHELRQPRVTHAGGCGDALPLALPGDQGLPNFRIERFIHRLIVAMFCYSCKQHIARPQDESLEVDKQRSITEILAANLRHFMQQKGLKQAALATRSGMGQTTISLYLNPENRASTSSGVAAAPTLARVQSLADALGVELWELLRPLTQNQRDLLRSVEAVVAEHAGPVTAPQTEPKPTKPKRARAKGASRKQPRKRA